MRRSSPQDPAAPRRTRRPWRALAAAATGAALLAPPLVPGAVADEGAPSQAEVDAARDAASAKARDVAAVRADLVGANAELEAAAVSAAQAAEAWNGARWRLRQARSDVRAAERRSASADRELERQRTAYADSLATGYQLAPELSAVQAITRSEGISDVVEQTSTFENASSALDAQYDAYRATVVVADTAAATAQDARDRAADLESEAAERRDAAAAEQDAAQATAAAVATRKTQLIGELADLQHISVALATRRQAALERAAAEAAAEAAREEAEAQAQQAAAQEQSVVQAAAQGSPSGSGSDSGAQGSPSGPTSPQPSPEPEPQPAPAPEPSPSRPRSRPRSRPPSPRRLPRRRPLPGPGRRRRGRDRLRPRPDRRALRVGAAGPSSWDCSGAHDGRLEPRREVAAALLRGAVRSIHPVRRRAAGPATSASGAPRRARRRSTTSRSTPGTG